GRDRRHGLGAAVGDSGEPAGQSRAVVVRSGAWRAAWMVVATVALAGARSADFPAQRTGDRLGAAVRARRGPGTYRRRVGYRDYLQRYARQGLRRNLRVSRPASGPRLAVGRRRPFYRFS